MKQNENKINLTNYNNIVILSGAGVSTLSGISDYTSMDLIWSELESDYFDYNELMSARCFSKKPKLFYEYFNQMITLFENKQPSIGHYFAKELYDKGKLLGVITQNIDGLYRKVIPKDKLVEIHGNHSEYKCVKCHSIIKESGTTLSKKGNRISKCCDFLAKPNVVLFGDNYDPDNINTMYEWLEQADCLLVMGTNLKIIPLHQLVANFKKDKLLINKDFIQLQQPNQSFSYSYELDTTDVDWTNTYLIDLKDLDFEL